MVYSESMSLDIDPKVERDLTKLADMQNVTVNVLLREFTAKQRKYLEGLNQDMQRLEEMKKDGGIPHDEMIDWLEDLATGKAL